MTGEITHAKKNYRTDNAVEKVEAEYENYNNRRDNTGPDENDEATMLLYNVWITLQHRSRKTADWSLPTVSATKPGKYPMLFIYWLP